jgi:hypothetical protein
LVGEKDLVRVSGVMAKESFSQGEEDSRLRKVLVRRKFATKKSFSQRKTSHGQEKVLHRRR